MKKRLLIISKGFPPFPAPESQHTVFLCEQFAKRDLDVHLLTTKGNADSNISIEGCTIHRVLPAWGWSQFQPLAKFLRENQPDAILLVYLEWIYESHPMITFLPTLVRRILPGTRFVTQFENVSGLTKPKFPPSASQKFFLWWRRAWAGLRGVHPVYGTLLRDSSAVIALSERHLETFEKAHPGVSHKTKVIPAPPVLNAHKEASPGSARALGRKLLGATEEQTLLVYFGFLYWLKGIDTLLAAFSKLPASTRLLIIGKGDDTYVKNLRELSLKMSGAERVEWLGFCADEAASLYLRAADICVLPFVEGIRLNNSSFAVVVDHGLPVVTTRGEIMEEPFIDGENVRLCPPNDAEALARTVGELMDSPALRQRLSDGARELAEKSFSTERIMSTSMSVLFPEEK